MAAGHVGQHAAFIEEHQTLLCNVFAVLLSRPEAAFLSRLVKPPQRSPDRPEMHPHIRLLDQAVTALS